MKSAFEALAKVTGVARSPSGHADHIRASRVQVLHVLHDGVYLEMVSRSSLGSDLLSCMRTKIARRAVKLDASDCVPAFVQEKVFSSNSTAD